MTLPSLNGPGQLAGPGVVAATVTSIDSAGAYVIADAVDANRTLGPMETLVSGLTVDSRVLIGPRADVAGTWIILGEFATLPAAPDTPPATAPRSSTIEARWKVRKRVSDTFGARWAVAVASSHPVSDTFTVRWAVRRRISATLDARWRVFTNINNIGTDLRAYARLAGDQIVIVPNGIYTVGYLSDAAHPATGGALHGWIILVAETPGGVIVNQAPPANWNENFAKRNSSGGPQGAGQYAVSYDLELEGTTSRVAFVGMNFTKGTTQVRCGPVGFYDCDFSFSAADWDAEPGHRAGGAVNTTNGVYHNFHYAPRTLIIDAGAGQHDTAVVRCKFHDTGTAMYCESGGANNLTITGVEASNLTDGGVGIDPLDHIHPDCFAAFGNQRNTVLTDFYFHPENPGTAGMGSEAYVDAASQLTLARGWITRCGNAGSQLSTQGGVYNNSTGAFIRWHTDTTTITITDVAYFDNGVGHGSERNDPAWNFVLYWHDAQVIPYGVSSWPPAGFVHTVVRSSDTVFPAAGTPDPFTAWKALPGHTSSAADARAQLGAILGF